MVAVNPLSTHPTWLHLREALTLGVCSGMPRKPGMLLRKWLYTGILAKLGKRVAIDINVELINAHHILIGDDVLIERNCYLDAGAGDIHISDRAFLRDNVRFSCNEASGQITLDYWARIDRGVDIKAHGGQIHIGRESYLGPYVCLAGPGSITIGSHCMIAAHSGIYANNHIFDDLTRPIATQGTTHHGIVIEDDCWLGTGVKVLDGVRIGRGSVIGAGAVVTKDIPPHSVAVGVPARVVRQRGTQSPASEPDRLQVAEALSIQR